MVENSPISNPFVSVIIVNYNDKNHILRCLGSLSKQTYKNFEVIFVDNASTDGSVEYLKEIKKYLDLPSLRIIVSNVNLGCCGGNNLGIKYARGEYLILLNPDTCMAPTWLEELVKAARSDSKIGICQSKILYPDHRINTTGGLIDFYGLATCRGIGEIDKCQYDESLEGFFFASGASLLIKKSVFEDIGSLDDKLFLYYDDVDLSWRARLKGYYIHYVPTSLCIHFESSSLRQFREASLLSFYYNCRNRIRVLLKNYGSYNVIKRIPITLLMSLAESLSISIKKRDSRAIFMFLKALLWNMRNLKDTWKERRYIQKSRIVSDKEIEKFMHRPAFIIESFKRRLYKDK